MADPIHGFPQGESLDPILIHGFPQGESLNPILIHGFPQGGNLPERKIPSRRNNL